MNNFALTIADHVDALLAYWDNNQVCRYANKAYKEWFGKSEEEMVDKITMKDLLGPLYEKNLPYITGVLQGTPQHFEREIQIPSGEKRFALASYIPDIINGDVKGFFVHVADITRIKSLEMELRASELKFRGLLESAPDAIIIINNKGEIQIVNIQVENQFGYKREELQGQSVETLIPERYRLKHEGQRAQFFSNPATRSMGAGLELFGLHKNGKEFPVEISLSPIELPDGLYVSVAIRDISVRKRVDLALKESNESNKIFIQQSPNALAMFDKEMRYMAASEKWYQDYNLVGKDILGKSHYEIFPEIGEDWKHIHQACMQGAINQCDEAPFERADGTLQWITWSVRPWYISEGNIGGLLMYTADITHIKEKDLEKRRIEEILDKTNEIARIGTWEVDLLHNKIKWSRITKEIHEVDPGYEPALDEAINFFKEGKSRDLIQHAVSDAIVNGTTYDLELELVTAKGNVVWARAIGQADFKNGLCTRLYGVFQDIGEIKKATESLNKLNDELNAILNAGYVSIIGTDSEGLITHFSKGAEMLLQYTADEVIGIHTPALLHAEEEVIARGKELTEYFGRTIEGFNVFVEIAKEGSFESREWTYIRKDGSTFPVQLVVTAIRNANGEVRGFLGVATDISKLKKTEKEMQLLLDFSTDQNNRLKNFAYIVSHNLRSHAGNIDMLLDLYTRKHPEAAENKIISHIKTASESLKETILNLNEVVTINNLVDQNLASINLQNAIEHAVDNVRQLATNADVIITNKVSKSISIEGLPAYVDSILLNFLTNGIKYKSPDRKGQIELSAILKDNFVILSIRDNGLGIDLAKNGDKLFGMYKTFHDNKDARGIGLFITKNQVEAMGGKIEVESEVNVGTLFKIYLKHEKN